MRLLETAKFRKQREKLRGEKEKEALKKVILEIMKNPLSGKKLKGELAPFRSCRYTVTGQPQRLIYKFEADTLILFSFGPRQGIYKS